jgi:hypothetical protein
VSAGPPIGNQNARKAKRWENALTRALARAAEGQGFEAGLDKVADQVVKAAVDGDKDAWQEIGNRLDGKAHQSIDATVDGGEGLLALLATMKGPQ